MTDFWTFLLLTICCVLSLRKKKKALKIQSNLQTLEMITAGKIVFLYKTLQGNKTLPVSDQHFHVSFLPIPLSE